MDAQKRRYQHSVFPLARRMNLQDTMTALADFPDELIDALWRVLRAVQSWAVAKPEVRPKLFTREAVRSFAAAIEEVEDPSLAGPLRTVNQLLRKPAEMNASTVSGACIEISWWAETKHSNYAAAWIFANAASMAAPLSAPASLRAAIVARRRADYAVAATWFRETLSVARKTSDRDSRARAFYGLGKLYAQRGNIPRAKEIFAKAQRVAKRYGIREVEAMVAHDMLTFAGEAGNFEEADRYAETAFEAYGPDHPELPVLAHDAAYTWLLTGRFSQALSVFGAVVKHIVREPERFIAVCTMVRAAAGAQDKEAFEEAWRMALSLRPSNGAGAAEAYLDLAHGAATMKEWRRARAAARQAMRMATDRSEARIQLAAEAILEAIHRHGRFVPPVVPAAPESERATRLAGTLVLSLETGLEPFVGSKLGV